LRLSQGMHTSNSGRIIVLLLVVFLAGCSQESTGPVSVAFHNTAAHYNAYFYSNQRIKEVEERINEAYQPNYDQILPIYPPLDSSFATTYKVELEDAIKKASLPLQYHKNSKWVDDCYNLIGMARLYGYDFPNAVETFKYVNKFGTDDDARHFALIKLMRTFTENYEYNNAIGVSDFLKKEKLNKENLTELYLTRAYHYQVREDYNNLVQNLALALPLVSRKQGKARLHYIIGQVYEEVGFKSQAYDSYRQCLGSNPDFELSFYAKLRMARVTSLTDAGDVKKVRKYFRKLIKDDKNFEFLDKIYYEWGEFEFDLGNIDQSIANFEQSIRSSEKDRRQKGISYLRLGEINFDTLKRYEVAQAYYDSSLQVLPGTYEGYAEIKERADVLDDFVTQIRTVELQDSLLTLAEMDSTSLNRLLMAEIERMNTLEAEEERNKARQSKSTRIQSLNIYDPNNTGIGGSNWYFDNMAAISQGQQEFQRIWGRRELEDNWRRSQKQSSNFDNPDEVVSAPEDTDEVVEEISQEEKNSQRLNGMLATIPRTDEEVSDALSKIEYGNYQLGNIYYFNFEEEDNASAYYKKVLARFPESEYRPEVLYLLYLIYQEKDSAQSDFYKDDLLENYPNSTYAKLIINPNYKEESNINLELQQGVYEEAYRLYQAEEFKLAIAKANEGLRYPETSFTARLELLRALIIGKFYGKDDYIFELNRVIEKYPDNDITEYAQFLLETAKGSELKGEQEVYDTNIETSHYFVMVYSLDSIGDETIRDIMSTFNESFFEEESLKMNFIEFSGTEGFLIVRKMLARELAISYYDKIRSENPFNENPEKPSFDKFVITTENFDKLLESQLLVEYMSFFEKYY